ncbi:MAG: phospholipid carrier-dependent glycosyltransferase [Candidatus Heimdallarchaeota archaeon]
MFETRRGKIKNFIQNNWIILLIWLLAVVVRILASAFSKGSMHPDEHYQSIEVVYYKIFGTGWIPWEFEEGVRSWVYPGIVYVIFKIMIFFGATNIETILIGVRLFSALCSMITVITAYYFGKLLFSRNVGIVATVFVSFWHDFIFWSTRTMTDSIAVNFVFLGAYFIVRYIVTSKRNNMISNDDRPKKRSEGILPGILSGFCFGLAFMFKFPTVILAFPLLIWLMVKKYWKASSFLIIGLGFMVIIQGIIDVFTWGTFLHSAWGYLDYNILSGQSAGHGVSPFLSYLPLMFDAYGEFFLLFLLFIALGVNNKKINLMVFFLAIFLIGVFSFIGHKEYRFILPAMPFLVLFAAKGFTKYPNFIKKANIKKGIYVGLATLTLAFSLTNSFYIKTFQPDNNYCEAVQWATQQNDAEYVFFIDTMLYYTPGKAYAHEGPIIIFSDYLFEPLCDKYQNNQYYILIPNELLERFSNHMSSIFNYWNIDLCKIFAEGNILYDDVINVFKNNLTFS